MAHQFSLASAATLATALHTVRTAVDLQQQQQQQTNGEEGHTKPQQSARAAADGADGLEGGDAARLARKRKADTLQQDEQTSTAAGLPPAAAAAFVAAATAAAATPAVPPTPLSDADEDESMDTSEDARSASASAAAAARPPPLPALPASLSAASAATRAFLSTVRTDPLSQQVATAAAQPADEDVSNGASPQASSATGESSAATEIDVPPIVEEKPEPCTHYVSRGPAAAAALLAAHPPPPLPSYAAMQAAGTLARSWPFTLDEFQQRSVEVLENGQHLLVAAHTSAGKTVVAEYAIAKVFRENARRRAEASLTAPGGAAQAGAALSTTPRRVIYTAPIKALSNQKFREYSESSSSSGPGEIGLLTGDVMLNPSAPCLIMTTEILRSMLYNGSEVIGETDIVIFDEIHYMKDVERGIIWEECIIMLPPDIQCVFLSATLSNAQEFAEWVHEIKSTPRAAAMAAASAPTTGDGGGEVASAIASLAGIGSAASARPMPTSMSAAVHHRATCHVVYTNTRPIPLRHYGFLKGGAGIYQIKTDKVLKKAAEDSAAAAAAAAAGAAPQNNSGTILTANIGKLYSEMVRLEKSKADEKSAFSDLIKAQASRSGSGAGGASSAGGASNVQAIHAQLSQARAAKRSHVPDVVRLVSLCVEQQWLPALFFSFSRRECEGLSLTAVGDKWKLDLTSPEEKECVRMVWARAMEGLDKDDRQLKPLQYMYPLLLRGFAVHHSGLLPLLKEVVEILFQEGLVRVLFCTETFAMGLNMPARCVVFSSLSKFDGRGTRYLQASEYIQMAGRAGRRGQDSKGIVICMLDKEDLEAPAADQSPDEQSQQIGPDGKPVPRLGGMLRHLLMGSTDPLQSKFRLTYNMILNLIRCSSSFDPAFILSQSFLHFQQKNPYHRHGEGQTVRRGRAALGQATKPLTSVSAKRARMGEGGVAPEAVEAAGSGGAQRHSEALASVAELQEDLADFDKQIADLPLTKEQQDHVVAYQKEYAQLQAAQLQLHEYMLRHPTRCLLPFLQSGRLVFVATPAVAATNTTAAAESRAAQEGVVWGWGIVLNWRVRHAPMRMEASSAASAINASSSLAAAIAAMEDTEEAATGPVPVVAEVQPRGHELDDADDEAPASPSASPIPVGASPPSTPLPASAPATAPVLDRTPSQQQQQASPAAAAYQAPRFHPAEYVVDVLLPVRGTEDGALDLQRWGDVMIPQARQGPHGPQGWLNGEWDLTRPSGRELRRAGTSVPGPPHHIVSCSLRMLQSVSAVRVYLPPDLRLSSPQAVEMRSAMFVVLDRATDNFAHRNLPKISLDDFPAPSIEAGAQPPADSDEGRMNARAEAKATALSETLSKLEASLSSSPVHDYSLTAVQEFLKLHVARSEVHGRLASLSGALGTSHLLSYRVELATRLRILRRFRHLTSSGVITAKGRIAADIECADELLLTEFIYEGHWTRLDESELLAVLTCWLDVERSSAAKLTPPTQSLRDAYARVRELAQTLASASSECGLLLDSARYVASFKPDLLAIMHAWLSDPSLSFAQLASMSDLFEGTLIRLARRLDELVNQLRKAAQAIGEKMLDERLAKGQARLKRGIMFAGSLYI